MTSNSMTEPRTAAPPHPPIPPPPAEQGLTEAEARRRLAELGSNELSRSPRVGVLHQITSQLANPLMLILLAAAAVSGWVGHVTDALIIAGAVALSVLLDAVQTTRSMRAADRLRQGIVPTATVRRDGAWRECPRAELVPGDVVRLTAGDLVPADARLVEARDLHVQQPALTGESLPVQKTAGDAADVTPDAATNDPARPDLVFLGTSVVAGYGVAVVVATGARTAFGEIAARLGEVPPETEFTRGLGRFGRMLGETVVFLVLFLVLVSVVLRRDPLESLLFAVALAVGIVPEFMPMITTLTLASGAVRMARRRVIVKHLAAIQNFGGIDVLCSDKTGTLTRGTVALAEVLDAQGRAGDDALALAALNARWSPASTARSTTPCSRAPASRPATGARSTRSPSTPSVAARRSSSRVRPRGCSSPRARRSPCSPAAPPGTTRGAPSSSTTPRATPRSPSSDASPSGACAS